MNTKGTVWSNSVAQYFKNFEVFLHECLTLSQPEPADESVGEHDEIEPRFEWNWKKKHRRCGEVGVSVSENDRDS